MIGGNLDQDDPDAVGVLYHISIKPDGSAAGSRMTGTPAAASRAYSAWTSRTWIQNITERPRWVGRMPGDLEKARTEKEYRPGIFRLAELPVDGQAQNVAVEATAPAQVAGAQEDPAAQNVHATIRASRCVTREVEENARSPA